MASGEPTHYAPGTSDYLRTLILPLVMQGNRERWSAVQTADAIVTVLARVPTLDMTEARHGER